MVSKTHLDHVALLVRSVAAAAGEAAKRNLVPGPKEEFPGEGTAEIYMGGDDATSRLLLLEPIAEGPYAKALAKRGQGLHHICLLTSDVDRYVAGLAGSGWLLHPSSLASYGKHRTVWLARPGTRALIEVHERAAPAGTPSISQLEIPMPGQETALFGALGCEALRASPDQDTWLTTASGRWSMQRLLN